MILYSYIITRDYGFAPNPFPPYCTLATCKPKIRKSAHIGDWVIGVGSAAANSPMKNRLIYAMQINEKLTYDQYWNDQRFIYKKPVMNGSKKQMYGDNIYHTNETIKAFVQENSHHSLDDGSINEKNYKRDLPGEYVLISKYYWYFGKDAPLIPYEISDIIKCGIGQKNIDNLKLIDNFVNWLLLFQDFGYIGKPFKFSESFKRYEG